MDAGEADEIVADNPTDSEECKTLILNQLKYFQCF